MRIRSGGQERSATIIVVGRTAHYGGPFKITTGASLFEDSFEMLTNSAAQPARLSRLPAGALAGQAAANERHRDVEVDGNVICEAAGSEPVYAQVDGEPIGPLPISFRIVPDALSIVAPSHA